MFSVLKAQTIDDCVVANPINNFAPSINCTPDNNYSFSTDPIDLAAFPPMTIKLYFWGAQKTDGTVSVTPEEIQQAFLIINDAFVDSNICFIFEGQGYEYLEDDDFFDPQTGFDTFRNYFNLNSLEKDAINILVPPYTPARGGASLYGNQLFYRPSVVPENPGILVHEIGHILGLYHTFSGYNGDPCEAVTRDPSDPDYNADCAGDEITDTNAMPKFEPYDNDYPIDANCNYTELGIGTDCYGNIYTITQADVKNYMGYARQECRQVFTTGQKIRMRENLIHPNYSSGYSIIIEENPTTELVVHDSENDLGLEPNRVTGDVIWNSPDIWVRNQPDGIEQHENPEYAPNDFAYVYVRVKNNSCKTSTGQEQLNLYWAKANTYFDWPEYWTTYLENGILMAQQLGSQFIPPMDPGEEFTFFFEWPIPDPDDYTPINPNSNEWHFCLLARITSTEDPITFTDGSPIGPYVRKNNNVAWKNLTVVDFQSDKIIGGVISVGNAFSVQKTFDLQFVPQKNELGNKIFEEAEVKIELSDALYNAWQDGGGQMVDIKKGKQQNVKIITGQNAALKNIKFDPGESGSLYLSFNFLTEKVSDKLDFKYHVVQRDASNEAVIGGETYQIKKQQRPLFLAGTIPPSTQNDSTTYSATTIGEPAVYNWYDPDGNLIHSGTELTLNDDSFGEYTLEVVADEDGYKDYQKIQIASPFSIESTVPNPATNQVVVGYEIGIGNAAYLILTNVSSTINNNYILDETQDEITLDLSSYPAGTYVIALICNGQPADSKNLIIQ